MLLPTRRACRLLAEALLRRSAGRALLLPRIQPLGEIDADEVLIEGALELTVPGGDRRRCAASCCSRGCSSAPAGRSATRCASPTSWRRCSTSCRPNGCRSTRSPSLVPQHLAEHWQNNRAVLAVIAEAWPGVLAAEGALDPAERRHRLLSELAALWRAAPPQRRIVAAGSTGSIPATRALLGVIATLPRGTVVLPGLDQAMDEASWRRAAAKPSAVRPEAAARGARDRSCGGRRVGRGGHRRHRSGARATARRGDASGGHDRAPGSTWRRRHRRRSQGLVLERHPDLPGEALALALRMRAALEDPERSAALVTRDRQLARRVAAELRRWGIEVDNSAGTPLDQTPPGAFLLLTARMVIDGVTPVALLAALKHPFARSGQDPGSFRDQVRALERACLRGPRLAGGFSGILVELRRAYGRAAGDERKRQRFGRLIGFVERLEQMARPFLDAGRRPDGRADRAGPGASGVRRGARPAGAGHCRVRCGRERPARRLPRSARSCSKAADPEHRIAPAAYPALLGQLMAARPVRSRAPKHPRLHIWGQLEARLQHADLLLLGGLNEGTWPALVDPGPWLSGGMRQALGLSPVERRIGLAAHDFVQAACAREVVLSRAEKDAQGNPTVPCRWLVRLRDPARRRGGRARRRTRIGRAWARALDHVAAARPEPRPAPSPPVAARPRELSVSDIGLWMKDPYDLYAKRILELAPLEALEADPGALERGNHHPPRARALRPGLSATSCRTTPSAACSMLGRELFEQFSHRPQVMALWWPRFERIAAWVVEQERARRARRRRDQGGGQGRCSGSRRRPASSGSRRAPIAWSGTPTAASR